MLGDIESRACPGCKKSAVNETGGLVVAFGQSFFHVDCFKCAKCNNTVTADTNLLLLSDGSPICADCSYNCNLCHQPILDEAIMTGDDSYHAHCFKCKVCRNRIDELVFAKTSHGIYCMNCHNDRMAKIRRHAQRRREKDKDKDKDKLSSVSPLPPPLRPRSSAPGLHAPRNPRSPSPVLTSTDSSQSFLITIAPPDPLPDSPISPASAPLVQLQSAPANLSFHLSPSDPDLKSRAKPYDDGVRPLSVLLARHAADQNTGALSVPTHTSRADKRRSINPALSLQFKPPPDSAPCDLVHSQSLSHPTPSDSLSRRTSNASLVDNLSSPPMPEIPSESAPARSSSLDPWRSASRLMPTLERPPQRLDSLRAVDASDPSLTVRLPPKRPPRSEGRSPPLGDRISVPASPSHPTDVPHGVESGTDTEAESSNGRKSDDDPTTPHDSPPLPPPKPRPGPLTLNVDPDLSAISQLDGSNESSPVERTSIATFIAPALPPIRFSMSGADFSDFLKSVGGIPSLKSLDEIAHQDEAPPRSPTSIHTLIPQDHVPQPPTDVPGVLHGDSSRSVPRSSPADDTEATDTVPNMTYQFPSRGRAASESQAPPTHDVPKRERFDSNASLNLPPSRVTLTCPTGNPMQIESHELVYSRLQEALADANARGLQQLRFEKAFVENVVMSLDQLSKYNAELKTKHDKTKASEQYLDALSVAQKEYDRELVARRNAESEIIRLRVLLSGQVAKLTALTGETSRREARRQLSEELSRNLDQLEKALSELKAERDVTLAEVEELCSSKNALGNLSTSQISTAQLSRSLTMRLDNIKKQYQHELIPLTQQRETLIREIAELKSAREQFLEETTVLNARNEELAQLSARYTRRMEVARSDTPPAAVVPHMNPTPILHEKKSTSSDRNRPPPDVPILIQPSLSPGSNPGDERDLKIVRLPHRSELSDGSSTLKHGKFKWPGYRLRDHSLAASDPKSKGNFEHHFQPASALRFTRCDHCGEKLWGGSHFRCATCHINVHSRCVNQVQLACSQHPSRPREDLQGQPPISIFGRDLVDQVRCDLRWGERKVPVIVDKCIDAVETLALDFEGIYRKTGGSSQTKMITHLFDQGDYTAFDLTDTDRFNDICSVTSVLKTYFRSLPVPLLTYDLHEEFIAAAGMKDLALKAKYLHELVGRLPPEHYYTLRVLVLHLHRVREHSDMNLMNARNLGVVFGPTLMWSRDPNSEFSDMAGKALMIEWLVDNAPTLFSLP